VAGLVGNLGRESGSEGTWCWREETGMICCGVWSVARKRASARLSEESPGG
jgi:hypothetical protein